MKEIQTMLTVQEAASQVKLTRWTIYRAIQRGDLVAYKPGGRLRINETDLQSWLESTRVSPGAPAQARPAPRSMPVPPLTGSRRADVNEDALRARVRAKRRKQSAA